MTQEIWFATTQTTAGYDLWRALSPTLGADAATAEIERRVQVRAVKINDDTAQVFTRLDGGDEVDEGYYALVGVNTPQEG